MQRAARFLCLIAIGFSLSACSREVPENVTVRKEHVPDEVFSDFVTMESDSGRVQWKLTAPKANRYNREKLVMLENPVIEFFDKEGQRRTTLVSEAGEYSEETRNMLAFGHVEVQSVGGDLLETDSLFWSSDRDKILSNSFVKLTRGRDVITGYGMECDPNLNSVDIKRNVQATIIDEAGQVRQ